MVTAEGGNHGVQFYEGLDALASQVVRFLAEPLRQGEAVIVIATGPHWRAFEQGLLARGVDVVAACASGGLTILDAHQTLAQFMLDDGPDAGLFEAVIGAVVAERVAASKTGRLYAYGEMVDVLWQEGQKTGALRLEQLWNDLQTRYSFTLLCAYATGSFSQQGSGIQEVCSTHTHVLTRGAEPASGGIEARETALPPQYARRLASGIARQERISRITAAIADAVSSTQVFEALVDRVHETIEATSTALWLVDEAAGTARLVRSQGYSEAAKARFELVPLDQSPSFPALDTIRCAEPIWIHSQAELLERYPHMRDAVTENAQYCVSCLPLVAHGRVLGALALTVQKTSNALEDERALLLLVARYASQAVERLRLFEAERLSRSRADSLYQDTLAAGRRAEQLYRFAHAVVVAETIDSVFDAALAAIEGALGAERTAILTFDSQRVMRFVAWRGLSDAYRSAVEGHSPWSPEAKSPEPVLVPDAANEPALASYRDLFHREKIGALGFFPLVTRGQLLGKFMVYYAEPREFASHDVETAGAIGNHLGSVITRFRAVAKLEETIRANELFAGVLAHDLRNPLGAIMTAAQLALSHGHGNERITKPLSRIQSSGQRISKMIDQLLDFTLARTGGGIRVQPRESDLSELCRQAIEEFELAQPAWVIHSEIVGQQTGFWDPERLLQVISNLIANAGQHGSKDQPIRVRLDGGQPEVARFEVHNQGGIPSAFLPHIFDPLRTSRHGRGQSRGLGLGLFIVRELVRAHGGTVEVLSSDADGTTFSVELPRYPRQLRAPT
jgi:signal transduction histidine kinase